MSTSVNDVRRRGLIAHLQSDYAETALYIARLGTIFSCLAFLFSPFFSSTPPANLDLWYRRALLTSAASWALRLHQRVKIANTGFNQAAWQTLVTEDAFHYLFYSVLFTFVNPVSVSLMPIFLYAVMHASRFTQKLLEATAPRSNAATGDGPDVNISVPPASFFRKLIQNGNSLVESNTDQILRWIALNEVVLFVVCVVMAMSGSITVILPFVYLQFVKLRYCSRRNPYCRMTFSELRTVLQALADHRLTPRLISRLIYGLIGLACRFCPAGR